MLTSSTAVIERNARYDSPFASEPFEAGWAREARWFVRVLEGAGSWQAQSQISPDGQFWCDYGDPITVAGEGMHTLALTNFGPWLRLVLRPSGATDSLRFHVYLSLKE